MSRRSAAPAAGSPVQEQPCEGALREIAESVIPGPGPNYYRILHIGCGLGQLLPHLRGKIGPNPFVYIGIDASNNTVREARERHRPLGKSVQFSARDAARLHEDAQLDWSNVIIVDDILDFEDPGAICEAVSKILVNEGVFHIRSRLHPESDLTRAEVPAGVRRGCSARERLRQLLVSFDSEGVYDVELLETRDSFDRAFLNLVGRKRTEPHFARYHYAFGYDPALTGLKDILAPYAGEVTHYGDSERTFRQEGYLAVMTEPHFQSVMGSLRDAVRRFRPGRFPIYLKDKLNIQHRGASFIPHQDATAGWNERIGPFEFVTFGLPLDPIRDSSYGGTRIAVRQDYRPAIIGAEGGGPAGRVRAGDHQFVNCLAVRGTYYAYDQYVVHDSLPNLRDRPRSVLFVTCILADREEVHSRAFARQYAHLLVTRPGLDVVRKPGRAH